MHPSHALERLPLGSAHVARRSSQLRSQRCAARTRRSTPRTGAHLRAAGSTGSGTCWPRRSGLCPCGRVYDPPARRRWARSTDRPSLIFALLSAGRLDSRPRKASPALAVRSLRAMEPGGGLPWLHPRHRSLRRDLARRRAPPGEDPDHRALAAAARHRPMSISPAHPGTEAHVFSRAARRTGRA